MAKGVRAGEAFVEILANTTKFEKGIRRAEGTLKNLGATAQGVGLQVAAAGVAMTAPFIGASKVFASIGDELDKMSSRTGISAETLSSLGFAAEQSGQNLKVLEKGIRTMQRSVNDLGRDLSTQKDAFGDLGLTFGEVSDLTPEEQFKLIGQRISEIENPSKRAAVAMQIFGSNGQKLLTLFKDGVPGIEKLQQQARDLGIIITDDQAKAAAVFTDELNVLSRVLQKGIFNVGQAVAPVISDFADQVVNAAVKVNKWIMENQGLLKSALKIAAGITALGSAIAALGTLIIGAAIPLGLLAGTISAVVSVLGLMGSAIAFLISPLGIITAAVTTFAVVAIKQFGLVDKAVDGLKKAFERLRKTFGAAFNEIVASVRAGDLEGAFKVLMAAVDVAVAKGLQVVTQTWVSFLNGLVTIAAKIVGGVADIFIKATTGIQTVWKKLGNFFANVFMEIKAAAGNAIDEIIGGFRKIGKTRDQRIAIDAETTESILKREKQLKSDKDFVNEVTDAEIAKIAKERDQAVKDTESLIKGVADAVIGKNADKVQKSNERLAKAQEELAQIIKDNEDRRNAVVTDASTLEAKSGTGRRRRRIENVIKNAVPTVQNRQLSASGSFNPFGASRQVAASFRRDLLKHSKDTADNTRDILRNQSSGGGTFQ